MDKNTELRKVPPGSIYIITQILDHNESWKKLMSEIPKQLDDSEFQPKYTSDQISIIEMEGMKQKRPCSQILFEEWGTSGKVRPTLSHLLNILKRAQLYRAADTLAKEILNEPLPERPESGPAAVVDTNLSELLSEMEHKDIGSLLNRMEYPDISPEMRDDFDTNLNYNKRNVPTKNDKGGTKSTAKMETNLHNGNKMQLPSASGATFPNDADILPALSILLQSSNAHANVNEPKQNSIADKASDMKEFRNNRSETDSIPDLDALNNEDEENPKYQTSLPNISALQNGSSTTPNVNKQLCTTIHRYDYINIKKCTNNFNKQSDVANGVAGKIGEGGFGEVYVAFGLTDKPVAVKTVKNIQNSGDINFVYKQFKNEIETLSKYSHTNIVSIMGYSIDPSFCIVCEYITGGTLRKNLDSKTLNMKQRLEIVRGTARGLEYLHYGMETQLIHRDIKSTNILLTDSCVPKLCDFGIAKMLTGEINSGSTTIVGTQAYMAPEAARGDTSVKSDVFSFGVVTIEVLTALPPVIHRSTDKSFDILSYVQEVCTDKDITPLIDPNIMKEKDTANDLFAIAMQCVDNVKKTRPDIREVCTHLGDITVEEFV